MSAISPIIATPTVNDGPSLRTIELRLLNCFYQMERGNPHPFIPIAPAHIMPLSASSSGSLSDKVIHQLIGSVHPDSKDRGEVRVGALRVSTGQFYNTLMDEMAGYGVGLEKDEAQKLRHSVAHALGAGSFRDLENAITAENLAAQREKLVENLAPVFAHIHQWFADHLETAFEKKMIFAGDSLKKPDAERDILVWTQMEKAMQPVEDALNCAIRNGALDEKAVYYIGKQTMEREEALPGIKVWSAAAQGLLDAAQDVVSANLRLHPHNPELAGLMNVLVTAEAVCKAAEKCKPENYLNSNAMPFDRSWAAHARTQMVQPGYVN